MKKKLIGIFATEISSRVQSNLYKKLNKKAAECGYHLVLFSGTYDFVLPNKTTQLTTNMFKLAEKMELAAMFIHAQSIGDEDMVQELIDMGKRKGIPVFVYDCEDMGITSSDGVITININYKRGFAESVKHVIECHDCKKIFMLAGIKGNSFSEDRIDMYRAEMDAHGIPYVEEQIGYGDFWETPALKALEKFMDSDLPVPDAICCANDAMAITATKFLAERGYRVPQDIIVTGFDGIEDGKYNLPTISTCNPDFSSVANFIVDVVEGRNKSREYLIPFEFEAKESCGCIDHNDLEDRREIANLLNNSRIASMMEHMLATMQVELIDSDELADTAGYMDGALNLFDHYSSVFCLRSDMEVLTDYTEEMGKMRVHLNKGFLPDDKYGSFDAEEVLPCFDKVVENAKPGEVFCFRLIHCADKMYGYVGTKTSHYTSNEMKLMGQFVEKFTYVIESILRNMRLKQATQKLSEMYDRMSEIYIRDTMTGLYNRHGYYQQMSEYLTREDISKGYIQIISVDMDGMKNINDNFGHMEGDNAIKAVATAISECFAQPCISARFGGDEFMLALFTEEDQEPSAEKVSLKLNNFLKNSVLLADKKYTVGVSVGRAVAKISEVKELKDIEKLADDQMYINKRKRKGEDNVR